VHDTCQDERGGDGALAARMTVDERLPQGLELRDAASRDAAALSALNLASWRTAYAHMLPPSYLAGLDLSAWEARMRERIADADERRFVIVGCEGPRCVGYVRGGPDRDDPSADAGEVHAIYIDPTAVGRGVGSALLAAAEERLARAGFSHASLWVFTRNVEARRFYERQGWTLGPQRGFWRGDGVRRQLVCYGKELRRPDGNPGSWGHGRTPSGS
jgi:ribosomal protein S18 acetylase RimI-like enzyme